MTPTPHGLPPTFYRASQMLAVGVDCSRVIRDPSVQTALAVLPIFASGERGCFVNLAANDHLEGQEVAQALRELSETEGPPLAAVHYGYPHFTKQVCERATRWMDGRRDSEPPRPKYFVCPSLCTYIIPGTSLRGDGAVVARAAKAA